MDQSQSLALILAIVIPFVAGILTRASTASWIKFVVVLVLSGLVGVGTLYFAGGLTFAADTYLITIAAIVGVSQTNTVLDTCPRASANQHESALCVEGVRSGRDANRLPRLATDPRDPGCHLDDLPRDPRATDG